MAGLARVLLGAQLFNEYNINRTYRGEILTDGGNVRPAIIKDLNPEQLANELVIGTLAKLLDLPTPDGYLCLVEANILELVHAPKLQDGNFLAYASADAKVPNIVFRLNEENDYGRNKIIESIRHWDKLGALYAFDTWVANIDRHMGNVLFGGDNEFWLIDHGHCLSGPHWKPEDLIPDKAYINRLREWASKILDTKDKAQRSREISALLNEIRNISVQDASTKSRINRILPEDNVKAANKFLEERVEWVARHAGDALGAPVLV